jgi:uncharacterized membrane protein YqjE
MVDKTSVKSKGLLGLLTVLAATLVAIARTRLDLLSTELEIERAHLLSLLLMAQVAMFCFGVGLILAIILLVTAYWDTQRLLVLGSLAGIFVTVGVAVCMVAVHRARKKPRMFSGSLSELFKDRQDLASRL